MVIELEISVKCDTGCVRATNEDMILVSGEKYRDSSDSFGSVIQQNGRFVAAVADGMGGHNAGEIASEIALTNFDDFILNMPIGLSDNDFRNILDNEIKKIHNSLNVYGQTHQGCLGMGTTLTAWLTYENRIYLINAGDSRGYRLRNGILCQLTTDHSVQNKNNDYTLPSNMIYNCLGGNGETAFADITDLTEKIFDGDVFLLCSDGLCDVMSEEEIEENLINCCQSASLVDAAKTKGGYDNISAIVLTIKKNI